MEVCANLAFFPLATERNPFRVSGILTNVKILMQKHIDYQIFTFLTLATERNPFRVSGISANDDMSAGGAVVWLCA